MRSLATVVQSEEFQKKFKKAKLKYPRINDSIKGVTWVLERSPEEGRVIGPPLAPKYRILDVGPPSDDLPGIWIAYAFENNLVTLVELNIY